MRKADVGICQRGVSDDGQAQLVFRNFGKDNRFEVQFRVTVVDSTGEAVRSIPSVSGLKHGSVFTMPAGRLLNVVVEQTSGSNPLNPIKLTLQPYNKVASEYDIFHFYHEEDSEVCWAIGSLAGDNNQNKIRILRSENYFSSVELIHSIDIPDKDPNQGSYRSIYVDKFKNIIIGWRPGPMISRDQGKTFEPMFSWMDPDNGMLCPFWNITEDNNGLMVISEYGGSERKDKPHGSHRGTFWSSDQQRTLWKTQVVDAGFCPIRVSKFGGYFRHIHGYHIHPEWPNLHHLFLGDNGGTQTDAPGYYISQDAALGWSDEVLSNAPGFQDIIYNGPCFITWWPNGEAFIVSDTSQNDHAYYWRSGPRDFGGPGFGPAVELRRDVDEESGWPDTPWMAMAVKDSYETYCTTSGSKDLVWRYDADTNYIQVLSEFGEVSPKWLSGSRHNRIPQQAKYFFTSGNRRYPRL